MKVEIWSDVVCPWCYIGKRRFEAALARFAHRDEVVVEWKSFELDPGATSSAAAEGADASGYADRLAAKYGTTRAEAQKMLDSMTAAAAAEGLDFRFDRAVGANTFEAHQLIHLAAAHGRQDEAKERLLRAYFTEGEAVGDRGCSSGSAPSSASMPRRPARPSSSSATPRRCGTTRRRPPRSASAGSPSSLSTAPTACPVPSPHISCWRCCNGPGARRTR